KAELHTGPEGRDEGAWRETEGLDRGTHASGAGKDYAHVALTVKELRFEDERRGLGHVLYHVCRPGNEGALSCPLALATQELGRGIVGDDLPEHEARALDLGICCPGRDGRVQGESIAGRGESPAVGPGSLDGLVVFVAFLFITAYELGIFLEPGSGRHQVFDIIAIDLLEQ